MTRKLIFGTVVALATLAGCASGTPGTRSDALAPAPATPPATSAEACNADLAESAVGQKASPELVETYRAQSGAKLARALKPRDVITMEYNPQRLNLRVDEQDMVISVNCG
ncbi:MAG: I78 family peptidase inhibitor [Pusillimonas sp.]